jgi:hypothetical protein
MIEHDMLTEVKQLKQVAIDTAADIWIETDMKLLFNDVAKTIIISGNNCYNEFCKFKYKISYDYDKKLIELDII